MAMPAKQVTGNYPADSTGRLYMYQAKGGALLFGGITCCRPGGIEILCHFCPHYEISFHSHSFGIMRSRPDAHR
jgi:hypothetical protein